RLVTKPCQNIRPASSNYLNYYIFSRIFGGGIVKLSRKIFTPQSCTPSILEILLTEQYSAITNK
ncbi:hypothetical protein, partial [Heyndrickxia coagulans]|uniref:hypothetical protein n=1 Tax=Heyndrickxia coagulans TaxID=1398 RepID=UPI003D1EBC37